MRSAASRAARAASARPLPGGRTRAAGLEPVALAAVRAAGEVPLGLRPSSSASTRSRNGCMSSSHYSQDRPRLKVTLCLHRLLRELPLEDTPAPMQAGHDRPHRDVEDLRGIGVAEVADVDQHDHVAEVVRHVGERLHDGPATAARRPAPRRSACRRPPRGGRRGSSRPPRAAACRAHAAPAPAVDVEVREDAQQPRAQVGPRVERAPVRKARA